MRATPPGPATYRSPSTFRCALRRLRSCARLQPIGHRFSYRVLSLLIDLDRLADADRLSPLFGVNRPALNGFHEADHGKRDGSSLRA